MTQPAQPPTEQPPQGDPAVSAAAGVTGASLAPVAAAGLSAVQAGKVTAEILQAMRKFMAMRAKDDRDWLLVLLKRQYPERTEREVSDLVREEMARETEFRRRMIQRMQEDIPAALTGLTDPQQRAARVQAILDREKRYLQMRQEAMADRAVAAAERRSVRAASPEGAFWKLGDDVKEHTLDCLAMGEKFWPWEVIDAFHPPTHPGCQCSLYTHAEAMERGLMGEELPDKADAIARGKAVIAQYAQLQESLGLDTIREYAAELAEVSWGEAKRIPRGFEGGGRFAPKNPMLKALHALVPHLRSPHGARRAGAGRWVPMEGRQVFVPEGRHFARKINGRTYSSPVQSTRVYRDGKPYSVPGDRLKPAVRVQGKLSTATPRPSADVQMSLDELRQDHGLAARIQVHRALEAQDMSVSPVHPGTVGIEAVDALEASGFHEQSMRETKRGIVAEYLGPEGSHLEVRFDGRGRVAGSRWTPLTGLPQPGKEPSEAPSNRREFGVHLQDFAMRTAAEHGHSPSIGAVSYDSEHEDHTGEHFWDGSIALGNEVGSSIELAAASRAAGVPLSHDAKRDVWAAYRTGYHEALHAANPIRPAEYSTPEGYALEEALTEEMAHQAAADALRKQGMGSVLAWAADNPLHHATLGVYEAHRKQLDGLFNRAGIPPEDRAGLVRTLKLDVDPADRVEALGQLLHEADKEKWPTPGAGMSSVRDAMSGGSSHVGDEFVPVAATEGLPFGKVQRLRVANGSVGIGSHVLVRTGEGRDAEPGTVVSLSNLTRDEIPLIGVQLDRHGAGSQTLVPSQVTAVLSTGDDTLRIKDTVVQRGTVLTDRGREYRVDRVLRAGNPDDPRPGYGWLVEATALSNGQRVWLNRDRMAGEPGVEPGNPDRVTGVDAGAHDPAVVGPGRAHTGLSRGSAVTEPGGALAFTRAATARRSAVRDVEAHLQSRLDHVASLEQRGVPPEPWEVGQVQGLGLASQIIAAGGTDADILDAALSRGPKEGGTPENVGFQSGMRSAALVLQQGGHVDLLGAYASPATHGHLEPSGHGKLSKKSGKVTSTFDPSRLAPGKEVTLKQRYTDKEITVRQSPGGVEVAQGDGSWKQAVSDTDWSLYEFPKQKLSSQPSLFSKDPPKPVPFDPQRAKGGQMVRDAQGNQLTITTVGKNAAGDVETLYFKDAKGTFGLKVDSVPKGLTLVPTAGWVSKPPKVEEPKISEHHNLTITSYIGKQGHARKATDPDGKPWVVNMQGGDADRVATQLVSNRVYASLGIAVPDAVEERVDGRAAAAWPLRAGEARGTPDGSVELGRGFMADALLANWDVVGKDGKNVIWDGDTPVRLDQGGTLAYRAEGKKKSFGPVPSEVWSMRSVKGQAFASMQVTPEDMKAQAQHIGEVLTDDHIDSLVGGVAWQDRKMQQEVAASLKARVQWMRDFVAGKVEEPKPLGEQDARDEFRQMQTGLKLTPEQHEGLDALVSDPAAFSGRSDVFLPGEATAPDLVGGAPLVEVPEPDFSKHEDVQLPEPSGPTREEALKSFKGGYEPKQSAGVIVQEPDGRIWTFEPKGHFGGYERTLSKGRVDEGQTEQEAALRELWEETGLVGEITGDVGWYAGTQTLTHYFLARRTGGAPWGHDGHETAAVYLQHPEEAAGKLQRRDIQALRDAGVTKARSFDVDGLLNHVKTREDTQLFVALPTDLPIEGGSLVGKTLRDKGYLTATTSERAARKGGSKAIVRLLAPQGSHLLYTRGVEGFEKANGPEVIGARHARLRIVGSKKEGDVTVLDGVLLP